MPLTRDQIYEASRTAKPDIEPMVVREFGGDGKIWVRGLTAKERDRIEESFRIKSGRRTGQLDMTNFRAAMAAKVIVNEAGERLFSDQDASWLANFKSGVLDRIIGKSNELSGGTEEEIEEMGKGSASAEASVVPFSNSRSASAG